MSVPSKPDCLTQMLSWNTYTLDICSFYMTTLHTIFIGHIACVLTDVNKFEIKAKAGNGVNLEWHFNASVSYIKHFQLTVKRIHSNGTIEISDVTFISKHSRAFVFIGLEKGEHEIEIQASSVISYSCITPKKVLQFEI